MKVLEKILVATDFSNASETALQNAIQVAKKLHSEIILLHVIADFQTGSLNMEMIKKVATQELKKAADAVINEGITRVQTLLDNGAPFAKIIEQAELNDVNVVMLGSGEKSSGDHYPLGTTAEKVLRKADKPVWIVRQGASPGIKKILCAVDFSEASKRALSNAIHLARQFQADLTVLHVIQPAFSFYLKINKAALESQKSQEVKQQAQFDRFLDEFDFYGVDWKRLILFGKADREIINEIRYSAFDLTVMGTVGAGSHPRSILGSVTEKVIREMPSSMITLKSENAIRLRLEFEMADIEQHLAQGKKLLENGFPKEALEEFEYCIEKDMFFAPAWEGVAKAHERLGNAEVAKRSAATAKEIREKLWNRQVEAELREKHPLWQNGD